MTKMRERSGNHQHSIIAVCDYKLSLFEILKLNINMAFSMNRQVLKKKLISYLDICKFLAKDSNETGYRNILLQ